MSSFAAKGKSVIGKRHDMANRKKGLRPTFRAETAPSAGLGADLSSQLHVRAAMTIAATDDTPTTSFWGYAVIGAIAIVGIYCITQA